MGGFGRSERSSSSFERTRGCRVALLRRAGPVGGCRGRWGARGSGRLGFGTPGTRPPPGSPGQGGIPADPDRPLARPRAGPRGRGRAGAVGGGEGARPVRSPCPSAPARPASSSPSCSVSLPRSRSRLPAGGQGPWTEFCLGAGRALIWAVGEREWKREQGAGSGGRGRTQWTSPHLTPLARRERHYYYYKPEICRAHPQDSFRQAVRPSLLRRLWQEAGRRRLLASFRSPFRSTSPSILFISSSFSTTCTETPVRPTLSPPGPTFRRRPGTACGLPQPVHL